MPALAKIQMEEELSPSLGEELKQHAGRWVAISREHVIAAGDTADEALKRARELGVDRPALTFVPHEGFFAYVL